MGCIKFVIVFAGVFGWPPNTGDYVTTSTDA